MNWCKEHWDKLRIAIEIRGLTKFIAKDGETAAANFEQVAEGGDEVFDPLMGSWSRINLYMLESPACNGRFFQCPLCILVEDGQPELVDDWINGCTDNALQYAIEQGLIEKQ